MTKMEEEGRRMELHVREMFRNELRLPSGVEMEMYLEWVFMEREGYRVSRGGCRGGFDGG